MKTKFNKSEILKRAWYLFKSQSVKTDKSFSDCLKKSWQVAKSQTMPKFNDIYKRYYNELLNYVNLKLHNLQESEELVNDVFVKINQELIKYNSDIAQINTWIYTFAKNAIIDHYRTDHSNQYINVSDFNDAETGKEIYQFTDNCKTDDLIDGKELTAQINRAMSTLKPKYQRIAELYFLQDKPYNEVAELLEIPLGTVKGMINRVRTMLQAELKPAYQNV